MCGPPPAGPLQHGEALVLLILFPWVAQFTQLALQVVVMTQLGSADPYYAQDRLSLRVFDKIEIDKKTEIEKIDENLNWTKMTRI